jgi:hypothetical protein
VTEHTLGWLGTGRTGTALAARLLQAAIGRGYRDADFLSLFAVEAASCGL